MARTIFVVVIILLGYKVVGLAWGNVANWHPIHGKRAFFFGAKPAVSITSFFTFGFIAWGNPFYRALGSDLLSLAVGFDQPAVRDLQAQVLAIFNSIEAVANLGLSLVLGRRYGMVGVALGTTVPITINTLFLIPAYVCRISRIDYLEYLRMGIRTVGVASASMVLPTVSLKFAAPNYK
jgi:hypothetical protein